LGLCAVIGAVVVCVGVAIFLYMLPSYIAHQRQHHNATAITALNLLLGWALLGWIAAFVWALTAVEEDDD
jgi:hypothetical protein